MRLGTDLIDSSNTRLDDWAMQRGALAELDAFLVREMPERVLECGSGLSTLLLGRYARATGATVTALEHQPRYYDRTKQWLAAEGLGEYVDLRYAALGFYHEGPWYQTALPDDIDFALIDGPPESTGGRARTFYEIYPHLRPDGRWHVWLDDAHRPSEARAVADWTDHHFNVSARILNIGRGLAQLHGTPAAYDVRAKRMGKFEAEELMITILTGRRPELLRKQLGSLRINAPGLLETARVHVLINGGDPETREIVAAAGVHTPNLSYEVQSQEVWKIGPATSHLARCAYDSAQPHWLHLEDDWEIVTPHHGWFNEARTILQTDSDVRQVRLRHITEPVLTQHMHTRQPITWRTTDNPNSTYLHSPAHWTFNPSLVRTADIPSIFPVDGERTAIRNAHRHGLDRKIAQHAPGVFRHIGGGDSLADKLKGR